jgi:hypothetical protein
MTVILFEALGTTYNKNEYATVAGCCFLNCIFTACEVPLRIGLILAAALFALMTK